MEQNQINQQAAAIVKALAYAENGGKVDTKNLKKGASGEMKSMFQFLPETWKNYSKQVLGQEVPLTPEAESLVVYKKVSDWLDHGFNTEQIASMWNAGERRPNAYKEDLKGTNAKGVQYDTPAYAKKVADYVKQFSGQTTPQEKNPTPSRGMLSSFGNNQNGIGSMINLATQKPDQAI